MRKEWVKKSRELQGHTFKNLHFTKLENLKEIDQTIGIYIGIKYIYIYIPAKVKSTNQQQAIKADPHFPVK